MAAAGGAAAQGQCDDSNALPLASVVGALFAPIAIETSSDG
jgi:hypothetical protein